MHMSGLATFGWVIVIVAMIISTVSAHRMAGEEYEKLRSLGTVLPDREAMGSWGFTRQFMPKGKSRRYHTMMIGYFLLLFIIAGLDSWL